MNDRNDRQNASGDPTDYYSLKDAPSLLSDVAPLWHDAFSSSARLLWRAIRSVARLVGYFGEILVAALRARDAFEELSRCGDAELARRGLTREDIPCRIAAIITGEPVPAAELVAVEGGRTAQPQTDTQDRRAA